jgi:hypothetical protein
MAMWHAWPGTGSSAAYLVAVDGSLPLEITITSHDCCTIGATANKWRCAAIQDRLQQVAGMQNAWLPALAR